MPRKKKDVNPIADCIDALQGIRDMLKTISKDHDFTPNDKVKSIYTMIYHYISTSIHQMESVNEYLALKGQSIMILKNGVPMYATETEKLQALLRKVEPSNIVYTKGDKL